VDPPDPEFFTVSFDHPDIRHPDGITDVSLLTSFGLALDAGQLSTVGKSLFEMGEAYWPEHTLLVCSGATDNHLRSLLTVGHWPILAALPLALWFVAWNRLERCSSDREAELVRHAGRLLEILLSREKSPGARCGASVQAERHGPRGESHGRRRRGHCVLVASPFTG